MNKRLINVAITRISPVLISTITIKITMIAVFTTDNSLDIPL